jgi:hypothetical protein
MDQLWVFVAVAILAPAQAGESFNFVSHRHPAGPLTYSVLTQALSFQA